MPSWNPYCFPQESPEIISSAHLCGSVSTASPPISSVVSPSRPSVAPFPPPLHRPHRTTMLYLGHVRRIRRFRRPRASHPLLSLPPTLPASAHHAGRAALTYFFFPPCASHPSPLPQPAPNLCVSVLNKNWKLRYLVPALDDQLVSPGAVQPDRRPLPLAHSAITNNRSK